MTARRATTYSSAPETLPVAGFARCTLIHAGHIAS
jgi:hypothetical protein